MDSNRNPSQPALGFNYGTVRHSLAGLGQLMRVRCSHTVHLWRACHSDCQASPNSR
jgi:hypothetical protein